MDVSVLRAILSDLDPWLVGLGYGALAVLALWLLRSSLTSVAAWRRKPRRPREPTGTGLFYVAALAGMAVSLNTSWGYFGTVLLVTDVAERGVMFFVLELAQVACGWGMRASIRAHGKPGPARLIAWFLCAVSAYMAWSLSGLWVGVARVVLGPILSLVMLHLALGIEIRALHVKADSVLTRVGRELRERLLAYLGLSDEGRDARTIARHRAVARAVRVYMTGKGSPRARRRYVRLLARADLANDPAALELLINSMKLAANVERIHDLRYPMPFEVPGGATVAPPGGTPATGFGRGATGRGATGVPDDTEEAHSGTAELQVEAIIKLIEQDGVDRVTIKTVKNRFNLPHTTAARQLRIAKSRLVS